MLDVLFQNTEIIAETTYGNTYLNDRLPVNTNNILKLTMCIHKKNTLELKIQITKVFIKEYQTFIPRTQTRKHDCIFGLAFLTFF